MNALILRNILLGLIGLIIILIGVTIYYAQSFLEAETIKTVHTKIDAELSSRDVDRLKNLERVLETNQSSVQKAAQIVSETKQYQYQDQIINDINSYANKTGVSVTTFDFGSVDKQSSTPATNQRKVAGVKSISVTLSLRSPMPFDDFLRFLKAIEQNLTKMQVSGINMTPDPENINNISNPSIVLIVYVK